MSLPAVYLNRGFVKHQLPFVSTARTDKNKNNVYDKILSNNTYNTATCSSNNSDCM